jgi:hypothetical protein
MLINLSLLLKRIAETILKDGAEGGDIKKVFYVAPSNKPPRRKPSIQNDTTKPDYMKDYMKEYRSEGNDYQKKTPLLKKKIRDFKKKLKNQKKLKTNPPIQ